MHSLIVGLALIFKKKSLKTLGVLRSNYGTLRTIKMVSKRLRLLNE